MTGYSFFFRSVHVRDKNNSGGFAGTDNVGNEPRGLLSLPLADTIREVVFLYQDLHELLMNSSSTLRYFANLPVPVQMEAHRRNDFIRTAEQLHRYVDSMAGLQD